MCLSQGLLTWTLILAALTAPASCLPPVNGTDGEFVYLSGSLSLPAVRQVTWTFNGVQIVIQIENGAPFYNVQYRGGRCELYPNTTLRLNNLTMADQGNYTLSVLDFDSESKAEEQHIELRVYRNLTAPTLSSSDSRPANGSETTLHCDDHNQAVTSYTFYRNQQDVCSQTHVNCTGPYLIFQPITEEDAGSYTCTIQNPISSNSSNALDLSVSVRVSQVKIQSNTSSILWVGRDSVSLNCSALGTDVQFSWNLNGEKLPSNPKYSLQQNNSTLIIHPVDHSDNGSFTCTASNFLNYMISDSLKLNLGWHPDGEIQCFANGTNETVNLFCSWPGGFPPANITLTFQSENLTGQDQVMHNVSINTNTSNDKLFCHGDQGERKTTCDLSLQKPVAEGFTNHSSIPVKIGEKAIMTVSLTGSAVGVNSRVLTPKTISATFAWYHYKPEASEVSGGNIVSTESSSTLTFNSVTANENGTYECRARNLFGTTGFFFILDVTEAPVSPVSKGLGAGEIAGIVIGVLAGLAIIGIITFFILKSKKKKAKAQNFGINSAENPIGNPQYAVISKKNGGVAETSLTNNPQDDKDDVKYAVIKFQNQEQTKPPNSEPEVEYSTVKSVSTK